MNSVTMRTRKSHTSICTACAFSQRHYDEGDRQLYPRVMCAGWKLRLHPQPFLHHFTYPQKFSTPSVFDIGPRVANLLLFHPCAPKVLAVPVRDSVGRMRRDHYAISRFTYKLTYEVNWNTGVSYGDQDLKTKGWKPNTLQGKSER